MLVRVALLFILCAILFLGGCVGGYPRLEVMSPLPDSTHCRVAVLPFAYAGKFPRGENIVYKAFVAELAAVQGFDVVGEGDVQLLYKQLRLYPTDKPNEEQMRTIAARLGAETLVFGDILRITELEGSKDVNTELTLVLNLYGGRDGKLLWSTFHKRQGEEYRQVLHYGQVNSLSGLARRMAREIIELWIENGMRQCTP